MKYWIFVLALLLSSCANNPPPPTPVAGVADVGTKIENSGNVILNSAKTANTLVGVNGQPLVSRANLDLVALAINKLGHIGITLGNALTDYNAAKAAGGDLSAQRLVVQQTLADISQAMAQVGVAIPNGTLKTIDDAVTNVLGLIIQIKAGVGL